MTETTLLYLIAFLSSITCSVAGTLISVQRKAMFGDAISHSVLLGLVLAYLITGERSISYMFIGAVIAGLLTYYLTEKLKKILSIQYDAALGLIFTFAFATAVILISQYARQIDLDQSCVLFGEIALTPFDTILWGNQSIGPKALWSLSIALSLNLSVLTIAWLRIKATLFSETTTITLGINSKFWNQIISTLVAITAVSAFESVGAILVVALMVISPNVAKILRNKSIFQILITGTLYTIVMTALGIIFANSANLSIASSIASFLFIGIIIISLIKTQLKLNF